MLINSRQYYDTKTFSINNPIYAKVLEYPFDDAPKLIFADWLEEQDVDYPCPNCSKERFPGYMGEASIADSFGLELKERRCPVCSTHNTVGVIPSYFKLRADYIRESVKIANAVKSKFQINHILGLYELLKKKKHNYPYYLDSTTAESYSNLTTAGKYTFNAEIRTADMIASGERRSPAIIAYDYYRSDGFLTGIYLNFQDLIVSGPALARHFPIKHWVISSPFYTFFPLEIRVEGFANDRRYCVRLENILDINLREVCERFRKTEEFEDSADPVLKANAENQMDLFFYLLPIPNKARSINSNERVYNSANEFRRAVYIAAYRYARHELFPEQRNQSPFFNVKNWK